MSRVAKNPIVLPKGVETTLTDTTVSVKGGKGNLQLELHSLVGVSQDGDVLQIVAKDESRQAKAMSGTFRSLVANMVTGVSEGFQKKLELQGVGYRAKAEGKSVNLTLLAPPPM